jgi:hypothetical protein
MTVITPDQLAEFIRGLILGVLIMCALGWFLGSSLAFLAREGIFFFLRRSPRWRRFDRAMRRLFA